jgi:asparaginyl-tRNA synthetase
MKKNPDGKTMQGTDVLFPRIGEIIGGSVREENYGRSCSTRSTPAAWTRATISWYLDTRKFGSCPHAGFRSSALSV